MSILYKQAAVIIQLIDQKQGNLKDVLFGYFGRNCSAKQGSGSTSSTVSTKVYALVCKTLSKREILQNVMQKVLHISFDGHKKRFRKANISVITISNPYLCLVMLHDLLCGSRCEGGGQLKRQLVNNVDQLKRAYAEVCALHINSVSDISDIHAKLLRCQTKACRNLPRYARIRSPTADVATISRTLIADLKLDKTIIDMIWEDTFVPKLLGVSPQLANGLCNHPLVKDGTIILQDKSSCLSVLSANITPGSVVLDCCAAPGNKTIQCLEHLQGVGYLVACEKDPVRACTLIDRLITISQLDGPYESADCNGSNGAIRICKKSLLNRNGKPLFFNSGAETCNVGSLIVEVRVDDFLNLSGVDKFKENDSLARIEVVILDPSCSGSGLPQHFEEQENRPYNAAEKFDRLRRLSTFQCKMLKHALTHFPKVATICYSTCSLYYMENQVVVRNALRFANNIKQKEDRKNTAIATRPAGFAVVEALPGWGKLKHVVDELREIDEEMASRVEPLWHSADKGQSSDCTAAQYVFKRLPKWWHYCVTCIPSMHNCRGFFLTKLSRTLTAFQ